MSGGLFKRKRLRGMWCMSMGSLSMESLIVCIKKKKILQMRILYERKRRGEKIEIPVIAVCLLGSQKAILFFRLAILSPS